VDINDLQAQVEQLNQALADAKKELEPLNSEEALINAEYHQIQDLYAEAMKKINAKREEFGHKKSKVAHAIQDAQWQVTNTQTKLQQAIAAQEAAEAAKKAAELAEKQEAERAAANEALTARWDKLTIKAYWREFAKDHQIDAGHKIVQDRNVILADPMGLGKTLSVIATCDMAYAATTETDAEHPFLGEEVEQFIPAGEFWTEQGINAYITDEMPELNEPRRRLALAYSHNKELALEQVGKRVEGFMPYDMKNRWINSGWITHEDNQYKKVIINQITRPVGRRILYLCPIALQKNVRDEWKMWAAHRNAMFIGGMSKAERDFALTMLEENHIDNYVLICNYEAWRRDWNLVERFSDLKFDTVIIDEAHNAKEMRTNINKGITHILTASEPEYIIPMTGTPVLNRPQELFTLLHMVDPRRFDTLNNFLFKYCEQDDEGFWKFRDDGLQGLIKQISKNFLRRTKDQAGIQLPPKTIINHDIVVDKEMYPAQAKARQQMREFGTIMLQNAASKSKTKAISATIKIAIITRLRQVETWPAGIIAKDPKTKEIIFQLDVEESQKIDYVIRKNPEDKQWDGLIPEAIADERVVLFSQFKAPLREIARRCEAAGYRAVILDGDTNEAQRDRIRRDFDTRYTPDRKDSKWDIVLCNYKVGGVGLNLTAATQLIALDEEWNPGKRDQAYDRIHRIGQEKPVTIHVIRNSPTIDDWMGNIMDKKSEHVGEFEAASTQKDEALDDFQSALDSGLI
jgi:SNF2 family DNA or RNA helicase